MSERQVMRVLYFVGKSECGLCVKIELQPERCPRNEASNCNNSKNKIGEMLLQGGDEAMLLSATVVRKMMPSGENSVPFVSEVTPTYSVAKVKKGMMWNDGIFVILFRCSSPPKIRRR